MNFLSSRLLLVMILAVLSLACGCGNKGDLYLPAEPAAETHSQPAAPDSNDDSDDAGS